MLDFEINLKVRPENTYRNLGKSLVQMSPEGGESFKAKLNEPQYAGGQLLKEPDRGMFTGDSWSSIMRITELLHRMEPFSSVQLLINDKLESRLFYSFEERWDDLLLKQPDKPAIELPPEFYYMPEVLVNKNLFIRIEQTEKVVSNIFLPKWAMNEYDLIRVHREALESPYVTQQLDKWLQMIFG